MRSLLLPIFDDDAADRRLDAAVRFARQMDGHVTCLQAIPPSTYELVDPNGGVCVIESLRRQVLRAAADLRERVEKRLKTDNVAWSFRHVAQDIEPAVIAEAGLADVVVLSRTVSRALATDPLPIANHVVSRVRASVLAVPPPWELGALSRAELNFAGHAVIAWDGSDSAAQAIRLATPLLRTASQVTVVTIVDDADPGGAGQAASAYLDHHGIKAEAIDYGHTGVSVGTALLDLLGACACDYLVMGAYAHSRVREYLFGGVTRQMLSDCPMPIILAH